MKFLSLRHSTKKSLNEEGKTLVFLKNGHRILISNKNTYAGFSTSNLQWKLLSLTQKKKQFQLL